MLVVEHGGAHAGGAVGDGVLGAALARIGHVAALARELLDLHVVEGVLLGVLGLELGELLAGDGRGLKGGKLAEAVFADHIGVDGLGAHAALLGDLGVQAGGVETAARADDLLGVVAREMPELGADHVAGVRDRDEDALKAGIDHALGKGARGIGGKEQLAVAVAGGEGHLAGGVDDDVAARELLVVVMAVHDLGVVGDEGEGVVQVLGLGRDLFVVDVAEIELVGNALEQKAVRHVGAHMALTDDADFARAVHMRFPSSRFVHVALLYAHMRAR